MDTHAATLATPLCRRLGIRLPIFQAPMPGISTPEMVAAVGEAGGLGFLGAVGLPPDALRDRIRSVRQLTDRPFGVNLLLHPGLVRPTDPGSLAVGTVERAQDVLDELRGRLGLRPAAGPPPPLPAGVEAAIEVVLEERVPVFSSGLGQPTLETVGRLREAGIAVMVMVATVADAAAAEQVGCDAVIAQGADAGGHRSWGREPARDRALTGTMALVPRVVDAVGVPVVAAGGIMDGRGVAAALALGAQGALLGTRFIATRESAAPPFHRRAVLDGDGDDTVVSRAFTGMYARVLPNAFTEAYEGREDAILPPFVQYAAARDIAAAAEERGEADFWPLYAGQGTGAATDEPGAGELVRRSANEAESILARLAGRPDPLGAS